MLSFKIVVKATEKYFNISNILNHIPFLQQTYSMSAAEQEIIMKHSALDMPEVLKRFAMQWESNADMFMQIPNPSILVINGMRLN